MKEAKFIKKLEGFRGDARLCELSPPLNDHNGEYKYVVVSGAVVLFGGPETYISPANESGEVGDYCELQGY